MLTTLTDDVIALLIDRGGLATGSQLGEIGFDRSRIARWVRRRLFAPLADGVYTAATLRSSLDDWTWFALRSKALVVASPGDAIAGSWSAVVLRDLPTLGRPPVVPSVIRMGRPPRGSERSPFGWTRFATVPNELRGTVDGVPALSPAGTVVDVGRRSDRLSTLMIADAVAGKVGGKEAMAGAVDLLRHWPRTRRARWAIAHADPDCESPLETVGRHALLVAGLPAPQSNVWIGIGRPQYRLDHYWADFRLGVEGDGIKKYRTRARTDDVEEALIHEKDRELEIRSWGVTVQRYLWRQTWQDPRSLSARCEAAMRVPPLPAHPALRVWSSDEGFRILGMTPPRLRSPSGGWRAQVVAALRALRHQ